MGLAVFLTDRGIPVLYEEKNESGAAWQIADDAGAYPDCQGVILAGPWRLLPDYGPTVHLPRLTRKEGENAGVRLLDYGSDAARAAEDADADALCLICGGKPWERGADRPRRESRFGGMPDGNSGESSGRRRSPGRRRRAAKRRRDSARAFLSAARPP